MPVAKYPWDEWADGEVHCITRGKDFVIETHAMRWRLLKHARAWGLDVVTWRRPRGGDILWFMFIDEDCIEEP